MNYENLKDKIATILLDHPADLFDDDKGLLFETDTWELVNDRDLPEYTEDTNDKEYEELLKEWDAKAVGSANLIVANTLLKKVLSQNVDIFKELQRVSANNTLFETKESTDELFDLIMSDLEKEKIIRKKPEFIRQSFKIVGGTDV
jgi:hypothetical protein